ncbi:helix-turn-helix domain-containing protein [Streptomyces sp. NPDC059255]|uniref:helix-turn-helix domain-containing protein n=1 Tax=Streptomyces sp. NPDC059255 TaxID=3346793 RepID=UPI0036B85D67
MKTRSVPRTRWVQHTEAGETRTVPDRYTEDIPVPPRDWDHILLKAALTAAVAFTGVSVVWSAVSGGGLLATTATPWVAYPVALAYDAAWITCLILEWLARHDPDRAVLPRRLGYAALAIVMVVIYAHGHLADQRVAGIAGAAISLIAKVLWSLVLGRFSYELPTLTREWVRVSRAEIGAELALTQERRQLDRMRGQSLALQAATRTTPMPATPPVATPATPTVAPAAQPAGLPPAATPTHPPRNTQPPPARRTQRRRTTRRATPVPRPATPPQPGPATLPPPPPNQIPPGATLLPVICPPRSTAAPATPIPPAAQHTAAHPATASTGPVERVAAAAAPAVAPVRSAELLLTVADVARLRGVKPGTVRSWVNRGKLTPAPESSDGRNVFRPEAVAALDNPTATPPVAPSQPGPMEGGYA